ncbi:hypothetical protein ABS768_06315 [Flavobacterium sp. ST-75]|uniref:WYL domain-containing protein n=1 Tax=Flavobacterium rhizophilum TaxID=3163296 RepID=A0ABW8YCR7_9FLAO
MARNPKIEFFKIILNSTKSDEKITFKEIFTELYFAKNPDEEEVPTNQVLMNTFYESILSKLDNRFRVNNSKKKAFYVKSDKQDAEKTIKFGRESSIIHGRVKGGAYDTGKEEGDLNNPSGDNKKLDSNNILLDDFYFLLYTPLNQNVGVLILQNYTSDQIADVFKPFVQGVFKVEKVSLKASLFEFMPDVMQKEFKENSSIKKFVFSNQYLISDLDDDVKSTGKFTVQLIISSSDNNLGIQSLPLWKKALRKIKINVPGNEPRVVESFAKQNAYIKDDSGVKANPTMFSLDDETLSIRATIYLQNHITLKENGIPVWKELENFAQRALKENVIPEIYPETDLDEN